MYIEFFFTLLAAALLIRRQRWRPASLRHRLVTAFPFIFGLAASVVIFVMPLLELISGSGGVLNVTSHFFEFLPEEQRAEYFAEVTPAVTRSGCGVSGIAAHTWVTLEHRPAFSEHWLGMADPLTGEPYPSATAYAEQVGWNRHRPINSCPMVPRYTSTRPSSAQRMGAPASHATRWINASVPRLRTTAGSPRSAREPLSP